MNKEKNHIEDRVISFISEGNSLENFPDLSSIEIFCLKERLINKSTFREISKKLFPNRTSNRMAVAYRNGLMKLKYLLEPQNLETDISLTHLSSRTKNGLLSLGIKKVKELDHYSKKEIMKARNLGRISLNEIEFYISQFNISLVEDLFIKKKPFVTKIYEKIQLIHKKIESFEILLYELIKKD